jgi:cytochrome c heme-lyase
MGNTASTANGNLNNASNTIPEQHPAVVASQASPPPGCPMHEKGSTSTATSEPSLLERLNPLNNIPALSQSPISPSQQSILSLERTISSIPRSISKSEDGTDPPPASAGACPVVHDTKGKQKAANQDEDPDSNWVYPSPQQFYNALMRKGKDTPEESIDVMVHIHNFLNERAWDEVRRWEDMRNPGERIELSKFEGRPQDLSPKARLHLMLGRIFPNTYRCALRITKLVLV